MAQVTALMEEERLNVTALHPQHDELTPAQYPPLSRSSSPAIEINNLVVSYGKRRAIEGLTLVVPRGSVYGLLGANGAGKTTIIKTLLGFRPPNGGSVRVLGYDVVRQRLEVCARVGYVSEENSLYTYLTIPQICAFCRDTSRQWHQDIVDRYLRLFDLPGNAKIGKLSKGMRMQLALCLALGNDPDLLLLDEPTAGLDPIARHTFLSTLVGDIASEGKTIFFSSHILADVEAVADWVGILRSGRLVLSGELDTLKQTHKLVRVTYAELPPESELDALRALPGVVNVEQEGRSVRLRVRGDADALATSVQERPYALRDVEVVNLNLEHIALAYLMEGRP
jgi:ABC-2 type transport system ATP-binding protein